MQDDQLAYRITISGYYGFGNIGDEAVLAGIIETFRRLGIQTTFTVLSGNPSRTIAEHPGVLSANRFSLPELLRAIRQSDLVISGGGSLFQDVTSIASPHYYLFVLRLARMLRRKTMVYAQGVGPLVRESTKRAVARALNRTDLITVRDPDSKRVLEHIGVEKPIHLSSDPSFLVIPDIRAADKLLAERGWAGNRLLGVSLRWWKGADRWLPQIVQGIELAAREMDVLCIHIPMQPSEDTRLTRNLSNAMEVPADSVKVAKGLFARCDLVVGMRLHSLMFAVSSGVPFVPLAYDPKVESFARMAGVNTILSVQDVSADEVKNSILATWQIRSSMAVGLARRAAEYTELALESGRLAHKLLKGDI